MAASSRVAGTAMPCLLPARRPLIVGRPRCTPAVVSAHSWGAALCQCSRSRAEHTASRRHCRRRPIAAASSAPSSAAESAAASNGAQELEVEVPDGLWAPEELEPLRDALARGRQRAEAATGIREALEAEAQEVAQLAVNARDEADRLQERLKTARAELDAAVALQPRLEAVIAELRLRVAAAAAAQGDGAANPAAAPAAPGAPPSLLAGDASEGTLLELELAAKQEDLALLLTTITEQQKKVEELERKAAATAAAAATADRVASRAMEAAEAAVRGEMEAQAVAKETAAAFTKALSELTILETSFEEGDEKAAEREAERASEAARLSAVQEVVASALQAVPKELQPPAVVAAAAAAIKPKVAEKARVPRTLKSFDIEDYADKPAAAVPWYRSRPALAAVALVAVALGAWAASLTPLGGALAQQLAGVTSYLQRLQAVVAAVAARIPWPHVSHEVEGLVEPIWLLLTSVIAVPLISRMPGGSPVLGFLVGGAAIGPYGLGIIRDVEAVRHVAELGVVFLLFNIGLELSLERLNSMKKMVFGLGTSQVVATLFAVALFAAALGTVSGPGAIILGGGLALSSTAVAMQVLADRNESGSRHGRATFSVLLLQDLAVVVLLMLVPLLSPKAGAFTISKIAKALGIAAIKAAACITVIIAGGRLLLRPVYRRIADMDNTELFAATTLLVVLGTSVMTQLAGLSLALGAFLAGLLLAETEFHMQVESDIAPYKGLLMGLFFMTVGMEISLGLLVQQWRPILAAITLLLVGKVGIMAALGRAFGMSNVSAIRSGLLLAAGGEFGFVLFGEAVQAGILPQHLLRQLFLVVALTMALTPLLAELGSKLGKMFEKSDMKALQPDESETSQLSDHVIIAGFGRVGQIIAQLLSERLIPFVALDVSADRVQVGKELDLPVYFGDAGSPGVLHAVGAPRAKCAVITLDTPSANYRSVWALHKHYPDLRIYVRAHDVTHGINLERAGATAVVPETLEPSLQLAAAVLSALNMPADDVAEAVAAFRKDHLSELQVLCRTSGSTLGYGFSTNMDEDEEGDERERDRRAAQKLMDVALPAPA